LETDERHGWLAGVAAVALTLSGQAVLVHAALAMLEMPGLLVSLLALYVYLRASKRNSLRLYVVASLLVALTALVKYPYGMLVLGAIGLSELIALAAAPEARKPRPWLRRWLALFGPFVLLMALWFAGERKIEGFLYYATLQPKQVDWYSPANLIFYPRSFALHYSPGPIFALVSLASVIWAAAHWRRPALRLLLLYALLGLVMMAAKEHNNARFILTVAPAVHVLAGAMIAALAGAWKRRGRRPGPALIGTAAALVLVTLFSLPALAERIAVYPALLAAEYETDPVTDEMRAWIDQVTQGRRVYFINPWDQFSTYAMEWYRATQRDDHGFRFGDLFVPDTRLQELTPERLAELEFQMRFYSTAYVVALEGGLEGQAVWPAYAGALGDSLEPAAAADFPIEFSDLSGYLNGQRATREGLAAAQESGRIPLNVRATVYRLLP
jgi:hypothetical protein